MLLTLNLLTGCDLGNTPTAQVEELLGNYQRYTADVKTTYLELTNGITLDADLQKRYQKLIEKQYRNLSYEIKDEQIDGDTATVKVEIKVTDYQKSFAKYNLQDNQTEYYLRVVQDLEEQTEKVIYTINFQVVKNEQDQWKVSTLSEEEQQKILGIYEE